MKKEQLLAIFMDTEPQLKSNYGLYGYPPMWLIGEANGYQLYARPARVMVKDGLYRYIEVDGVAYQHHNGEKWVGQGLSTSFEEFEKGEVSFCS